MLIWEIKIIWFENFKKSMNSNTFLYLIIFLMICDINTTEFDLQSHQTSISMMHELNMYVRMYV